MLSAKSTHGKITRTFWFFGNEGIARVFGVRPMNPVDLMVEVIKEHAPEDIWQGSPLIGYRQLGNTNRGEIGEEFIRRYVRRYNIHVGNGGRTSCIDLRIGDSRIEVKTASLGANGTFQFNHVRLDRDYDYFLYSSLAPNDCAALAPNSLKSNRLQVNSSADRPARQNAVSHLD